MADRPGLNWRNRIVSSGTSRARDLVGNEANWRVHHQQQREAVGGLLGDVGWVRDVIVNLRSSVAWGDARGKPRLVDGHLRLSLAMDRDPDSDVPVSYVDLDPAEEAIVLATLDPLAAMAGADAGRFEALMSVAQTEQIALRELMAETARTVRLGEFVGGDERDNQVRNNNNMSQQAGDSTERVGLQCREIMVVLPADLYERWWALCREPRWAEVRECVIAVLEAGIQCVSGS